MNVLFGGLVALQLLPGVGQPSSPVRDVLLMIQDFCRKIQSLVQPGFQQHPVSDYEWHTVCFTIYRRWPCFRISFVEHLSEDEISKPRQKFLKLFAFAFIESRFPEHGIFFQNTSLLEVG